MLEGHVRGDLAVGEVLPLFRPLSNPCSDLRGFVLREDDAFVRRDAIPLKGQGVIGLGRVPEPQSYHTVEFVCEDGPEREPGQ